MKRIQHPNVVLFAVSLAFAGTSVLQGCGDSGGGGGRKDAAADGKLDGPAVGLDGGGLDGATERPVDLAPRPEVADGPAVVVDTNPGDVLVAEPDGAAQPDSPQSDATAPDVTAPSAEAGQAQDLGATPDLPIPDAPAGEETQAPGPDAVPDSPIQFSDTAGPEAEAIDVPALDAGIDTAPVEVGAPGNLTGWPTASLDFGPNPCGGEAPAAKTFTLTNAGGTVVTLTKARFAGTAGYDTDAEGKTVAPGDSLVVTVHAPGVPQTANIPSTYDDVLAIKTDIPGDDQHLVLVSESAQGAVLIWDTPAEFGSFGTSAPGTTVDSAFHVINVGNQTAAIDLATTGQYTVTPDTATIAPRSAANCKATFVPSTGGAAVGTLSMTLASPVALCQPLPAALNLSGVSDNGAIGLSAISINFATECAPSATAPATQTLTLTDTGTQPMNWSATLQAGNSSKFQISPSSAHLTAAAGAEHSSDVTITPLRPTSTTVISDVINILTDATGDTQPHKVFLSQTPMGDAVSVVSPATIDLGSVPIASPAIVSGEVTVVLRNSANPGSAAAVVSLQMTGQYASYFTVAPAQVTIPAGEEASVKVTFSPGADVSLVGSANHLDMTAKLHWQVGSEPNCGSDHGDVDTSATATVGQVSGIPGQLDFQLVNCGETGLPKQISIVNSGTATYQVTAITLVNSSYYTVDSPTLPQTLTPAGTENSSMVVTVTPKKIPDTVNLVPDHATYDGSLTITTDLLGDSPHQVDLLMGARGAIITNSPSPTDWSFASVAYPSSSRLNMPVENTGNVAVTAALTGLIIATGEESVFTLESATLPANSTTNIVAKFSPIASAPSTTFTATANLGLSVGTGVKLCQPLPAGWNSTTHNIHMQGQTPAASP